MQNNPYIGPRPFDQQHQQVFFGRDEEIQILAGLTMARRALLFYAQSGAGKSSLLHAGLIPELTRQDASGMRPLPIAFVGRGREDFPSNNIYAQSTVLSLRPEIPPAEIGSLTIKDALAPSLTGSDADDRPALLIFDQFEEIYNRHRDHWEEREGFFKQIAEALDAFDELHVLFTMREDYIADMVPFSHLLPDQLRSRYRMERLKRAAAIDAIRKPAERNGCPFDEGVADALADNLRRARQSAPGRAELAEHVEPILLQIVCWQLWDKMPEGSTTISQQMVDDFANVDQALINFFNDAVKHAVAEAGVSERLVRRFFAEGLITPGRTRGLVYRGDTTTGGLPNKAIDVLNDDYIIRAETRGIDRYYELSHDRLLEPVRLANDAWQTAYVQQVPMLRQAREWGASRPVAGLFTGESLQEAERWLRDNPGELTEVEQEFLAASRRRQQELDENRVERRINLEDMGWGVIFPAVTDPGVKEALSELLAHRQQQAIQKNPEFYKEFAGTKGYRAGESAQDFLNRHGASFNSAGPDKMPHYLLIVGDPEVIPFEFQYGLDARFSVGRIHFETLAEYASYARSVVTAESGSFALRREAVVFNPTAPGDTASALAREKLVRPLLEQISRAESAAQDWSTVAATDEYATKSHLKLVLGGPKSPALLFSASHGLGFPSGDPRQLAQQGAILCGDWPGPQQWRKPIPPDFYFSSADVAEDARLLGLIVCMFAEYGAGTPRKDNFPQPGQKADPIAPRAFVSRLCQRLLGHPNGGVLAVIGHIDRQWTTSFVEQGDAEGFRLFVNVLDRLMRGHTAGSAIEILNTRYAQLASALLEDLLNNDGADEAKRVADTIRTIDARNYVVIGDPAARLPIDGVPVAERPIIAPVVIATTKDLDIPPATQEGVQATPPVAQAGGATLPDQADAQDAPLIFNGINGSTGDYAFAPGPIEELLKTILGEQQDERSQAEWNAAYQQSSQAYFTSKQ